MIQRIQSLYLFLTAVLTAILLFVPFARFIGGTEEFVLRAFGFHGVATGTVVVPTVPMGALIVLAALLPFVNIFLYRRRRVQMRLCVVGIVLLAGVQALICYYILRVGTIVPGLGPHSVSYSVAAILPLIGIILSYLALRGVKRDEALVKSLDRIR